MGKKKNIADHQKPGRKMKYETAEELEKAIDVFLNNCPDKRKMTLPSGVTVEVPCPTIAGLAYYLGFESRQSMYDYEARPEFTRVIRNARLFIEKEYEKMLQSGNVAGIIFALKNMGWKDKVETEETGTKHIVIEWMK